MPKQFNAIIADTSCFILLSKLNYLNVLYDLFGIVTTTPEVFFELNKTLPEWINIEGVKDVHQQQLLEKEVDNLQFTGTLGVLLKAKERGIISALKPILLNIQETNFRFSDKVFEDILLIAGET